MPPELSSPQLQLAFAIALGAIGTYLLLPKPKRRSIALGTFALIASAAIFGLFTGQSLGHPFGEIVPDLLFWFFSTGAVVFGTLLVVQRNPARGAIAFAFVILSSCGLFLLLAAPFLMAATIIIYAGAIIVTFLFVLMLSNVRGPSNENDRSREPLLGSLAGFAFIGLILFALVQPKMAEAASVDDDNPEFTLPAPLLTKSERSNLKEVRSELDEAIAVDEPKASVERAQKAHDKLATIIGGNGNTLPKPVLERLRPILGDPKKPTTHDKRYLAFAEQTVRLQKANDRLEEKFVMVEPGRGDKAALQTVRDELTVYLGNGQLPARNVGNIGVKLYSENLLAVEMAGTLLLVATIGAVAIAHRKKGELV